jgi:8-oxo-dGTP pyrophosphatase MutT (NUDIX family)
MTVRQVYGIAFDTLGRVVVQDDRGRFNLPGGTPEPGDSGWEETLARECLEESQITFSAAEPIGYQRVTEGDDTYAQVRYAALLEEFWPRRPDPCTGRSYERVLVSPHDAARLLGWGERGTAQFAAAADAAARHWSITPAVAGTAHEYVP